VAPTKLAPELYHACQLESFGFAAPNLRGHGQAAGQTLSLAAFDSPNSIEDPMKKHAAVRRKPARRKPVASLVCLRIGALISISFARR